MTPGWYLRRLRAMSPAEVAGRVQDVTRRKLWARRQVAPGAPLTMPEDAVAERVFGSPLPPGTRDRVPADARAAVVAAADDVLAGRWQVLGATRADSAEPDWFLDPVTGRRAPQDLLSFRVKHRDESVTGNVKQVWEMSRHHHVTVLAAAWWLTEEPRYAEAAAAQLQSWWKGNPFLSGVHWTSGIEAGVRLISWAWTRRLLNEWPKVGDLFEHNPAAVQQIAWHQEFLAGFPSRGSSANNHLIAEDAGRLTAACAFPWYARSERWRVAAARSLEASFAANTFGSGINRELATDYHRFVIELVLAAAVEADVAGHPLGADTWQRIATTLDAGVAILDVAGKPPRQGDGDEGRGLVVDAPDRDPWAVALGAGGEVLGAGPWWPRLDGSVQSVITAALAGRHDVRRAAGRTAEFADAGMTLLRSLPEHGPEIWVRADSGPHGFLATAAHGHADALSLEVRHDGVELLVDPGTYCYHGEPEWRAWFRSTGAHSTVQLAGADQSVSGGPFLWTRKAASTTVTSRTGDLPVQSWEAEHDGYRRLDNPAVHRRAVVLDSAAGTLEVTDTVRLEAEGPLPAQLTWHLGPAVTAELDGATATLRWDSAAGPRSAVVQLPADLTWSLHRGELDPPRGWYSPAFGERVPSTVLAGTGSATGTAAWTSTLRFADPPP